MNRDHLHKLATKYAQAYHGVEMAYQEKQDPIPALMRQEAALDALTEYVTLQIAEARRENR